MKVKLYWNEYLERWVMIDQKGYNILEIANCANFNILFKKINRRKINIYELKAELLEKK